MTVQRMTIREAEDAARRLPITEDNYWDFEALLHLPYDLFKPLYELLCSGVIYIEDLKAPSEAEGRLSEATLSELRRAGITEADMTVEGFRQRVEGMLRNGERPGYVVTSYDPTPAATRPDGSPGPFVGSADGVASADFDAVTPGPLERMQAEDRGENPKKAAQLSFRTGNRQVT